MPKAIGIDLGTTYSCVAVWQNDHVEIITNDHGNRTTPSCVAFSGDEGLIIGDAAKSQAHKNPRNTIFDVKRLLGPKFDDPDVQSDIERFPFKVINKAGCPCIAVHYRGELREFSPVEISSMILFKIKETAESYLRDKVTYTVVTVPAHFNVSQRWATRDAAIISGPYVLYIMNEPTAAAIAYGLDSMNSEQRNVLVYDLGGGSLDVTLFTIEEGTLQTRASAGNNHLGGEDFDNRLVNHFVAEFKRRHKKDLSSDPRALHRLRTACERAKRTLSSATQATLEIDYLFEGIDFCATITRARFEELCEDLFRDTLGPIEMILRDSGIDKHGVHEIVFVGGATRIPRIAKLVSDFFGGKEPKRTINPDEAVAHGAAIWAALLFGDSSEKPQHILPLEAASLSLGIETTGGVMTPFIKRGTMIPTKKSEIVSTCWDNQPGILVEVYEGEGARTKDNIFLGKFQLFGIPPAPAGVPQIEVTFDTGSNYKLHVSACDKITGRSNDITFATNRGHSSKEGIECRISDAQNLRAENEALVACITAKNDLELWSYSLGNLLTDEKVAGKFVAVDKRRLKTTVDETIKWLENSQDASKEDCDAKQRELESIANPIVQKLHDAGGDLPPWWNNKQFPVRFIE